MTRTFSILFAFCVWLNAASGSISIGGNVVYGNPTNLPNYGRSPTSWLIKSNTQLSNGGYATITSYQNWAFLHNSLRNPSCWTHIYDLTGFSVVSSQNPTNAADSFFEHFSVISQHCAITSQDQGLRIGDYAAWEDSTGALFTNAVSAIFNNSSNNLRLVQFSNAFPATITAFQIMPSNWRSYSPFAADGVPNSSTGIYETFQALWLRANSPVETNSGYSWGASVMVWDDTMLGFSNPYQICAINGVDGTCGCASIYTETTATGGDSGCPAFVLVNGIPTLITEIDRVEGENFGPGGVTSNIMYGQPIAEAIPWIQPNLPSGDTLKIAVPTCTPF